MRGGGINLSAFLFNVGIFFNFSSSCFCNSPAFRSFSAASCANVNLSIPGTEDGTGTLEGGKCFSLLLSDFASRLLVFSRSLSPCFLSP